MARRPAISADVVIAGAGGFGREVLDVLEAAKAAGAALSFVGFADDGEVDDALLATRGASLLGRVDSLQGRDVLVAIGVGAGDVRRRIDERLRRWGLDGPVLAHPAATVGGDVELGAGAVLTAGARLTTHIRAGRHLHVNLNATIGHDCVLGDYVTINPGANISGSVRLESEVTIGTGACVIQGVTIGEGTTVGAGAVVVHDLPPGVTAVGVPARPLPR